MASFIHTTSDPPRIREVKEKVLELRQKTWEATKKYKVTV